MIQTKYYTYLGENGSITSPVFLPDTYSICKVHLEAEDGFILSNGTKTVKAIIVPEKEVEQWFEIQDNL